MRESNLTITRADSPARTSRAKSAPKGRISGPLPYSPLPYSRAYFEKIKDAMLGTEYKLSLVIASDALSRKLNREFRAKDKPTDILSFSLGDNEGEIFLNLKQCEIKAAEFSRSFKNYLAFVFIHGLAHLNGFDHGSRMESEEVKFRKRFGV